MSEITITFTNEELKFIFERCDRKAAKLEESHLTDTPCYRLANSIKQKINNNENVNYENK